MLSFKQYLLEEQDHFEKRLNFLSKKYKNLSTSHDNHIDKTIGTDDVISKIMKHDPDQRKFSNSDWMVGQYHKGHYRHEDLPRVKSQVEDFHELKHKFPSKDLNKYSIGSDAFQVHERTPLHLPTLIAHHKYENTNKEFPDGPRFDHPEATKIYDDGKGTTVHTIDTHAAGKAFRESCGFKPNDDGGVCFGWKNPAHFNNYHKEGAIHVIQTPDNRKWSLHIPSRQFADKNDTMHEPEVVVNHNPGYHSLVGIKLDHRGVYDHSEDESNLSHRMPFYSERAKKHQIENDFEAGHAGNIDYHIDNHKNMITPHQTEQAFEHYKNGHLKTSTAIHLPHLNQEHHDHMWESEKRQYGHDPYSWIHKDHLIYKTKNPEHLHEIYNSNIDSYKRDEVGMLLHKKFNQYPEIKDANNNETFSRLKHHHTIRAQELTRTAREFSMRYLGPKGHSYDKTMKRYNDIIDWHEHMINHYNKKSSGL